MYHSERDEAFTGYGRAVSQATPPPDLDPIERLRVIIRRQDDRIADLEIVLTKTQGQREYIRGERNELRVRLKAVKDKLLAWQLRRRE